MYEVGVSTLESMAARALDELPAPIRERLDNLAIGVEPPPDEGEQRRGHRQLERHRHGIASASVQLTFGGEIGHPCS